MHKLKIIECPRDAMQGIKTFIPTANKVTYIQSLLRVGFDSIDFGSFVSHVILVPSDGVFIVPSNSPLQLSIFFGDLQRFSFRA